VALDSSDAGFRQQFFHLVFKFLAHQVVVGEADDEDFLDSGHGDAGETQRNTMRVPAKRGVR